MNPRNKIFAVVIMLFALALAIIDATLAYRFHKRMVQIRTIEHKIDRQLDGIDQQIKSLNQQLNQRSGK